MALWEKRRCGVAAGQTEIWEFCRFPIPCFVPGCHAFDFKIAAAALRPRNDTNLERFYLENGRFTFLRLFFARCRPASFFKRFAPKIVPFSHKTFLEPPALPVVFLLQGKALATVFCSFYCYSTKAFSFLGAVFCYSSILFAFRHLLAQPVRRRAFWNVSTMRGTIRDPEGHGRGLGEKSRKLQRRTYECCIFNKNDSYTLAKTENSQTHAILC